VRIDVTPLLQTAQALPVPPPTLQLRLLLDPVATSGLTIFLDPLADTNVAPLLEVTYR
jgi:hypothetical protein